MSTVRRIAQNTTVMLVAQVASYALSFFSMMYIARYLSAAGFGILSFALAFTGIFAVFADLGLSPLTVREVARDKSLARKYLANVSLMKVILAAVTFGLIALTINLMGYPQETVTVVYLFGLYVVLGAFTQIFYSIFQAFERMEFQAIGQMLNAALLLGGVILALKLAFSIIGFASLYLVVSIVNLVYSFAILKWKLFNPASAWSPRNMEIDWAFWKPTIKEALPFGLSVIFVTIYFLIDTVMLSLMKGDTVVGWYNAAYRLIVLLLFIPTAFNLSVFPAMSIFYETSQSSLRLSFEKYFKYMIILAMPIGTGVALLSSRFILLIFGTEYAPSVVALQILVWASVFHYMNSPFARLFEALNRQMLVTKIWGFCLILSVILNLILIPKYSYIGASVTAALTGGLLLGLCFIWSAKIGYGIFNKEFAGIVTKVIIASALMGIFIRYFYGLNLVVLILFSVLLYFVVLYIVRGIDKGDMALARRAIGKRE